MCIRDRRTNSTVSAALMALTIVAILVLLGTLRFLAAHKTPDDGAETASYNIELPRGFDAAAVANCEAESANPRRCPFGPKIVQIYFRDMTLDIAGGDATAAESLASANSQRLLEWLTDFL